MLPCEGLHAEVLLIGIDSRIKIDSGLCAAAVVCSYAAPVSTSTPGNADSHSPRGPPPRKLETALDVVDVHRLPYGDDAASEVAVLYQILAVIGTAGGF